MGLILPVAAIVLAAMAVPLALGRLLPEGGLWLIVNGALSALVLILAVAGYFLWSYGRQDTRIIDALGVAPGGSAAYFLGLGLSAGLIWAPVLVLTISTLPRRWKVKQW
ncbi:hypothetical protein [Oceaniglobus trochenteri]|uniref:hypothetical protein n=1 Tax=Oceaniglobus trochenteri TaxID=2763260 RepID=UPI001CFF722B|nr:hypothetical protein [Oceaniglobus trochenteri]